MIAMVMNAGTAAEASLQSISLTPPIIRMPTKMSEAAVAQLGMSAAMGARNIAMKNIAAVKTEERPVLPPSAMPAEDSTKVVTVEVPQTAPKHVAAASANMALFMLGTLPSLSSRLPAEHAPYRVPRVSNMSTMQNASMEAMNVAAKLPTPLAAMYSEKLKPSVKTLPKEMLKKSRKGWMMLRESLL